MSHSDAILKLVDVSIHFGGLQAINRLSFQVGNGQIFSLIGPNGAGKSTAINIITGIYRPAHGEIYFEGQKAHIHNPKDAKKLGIETVYQEQALAPHVSIARNVFLGREPTKWLGFLDKKKMDTDSFETLSKLGLRIKDPEVAVESLSGGQRQGVAIARVLYFKARLVILDEPTIALSVKESQEVMKFIKQLRSEGISVVFITHNIYHVYQIAERFVILAHGEKIGDIKKEDTSVDHLSELITGGETVERADAY